MQRPRSLSNERSLMPAERIERIILLIRGEKVILDRDLAALYGVSTRDLNKAVSRNLDRFPVDFMLQLTREEFDNLKFQFGTSSWGGTRKLPRAHDARSAQAPPHRLPPIPLRASRVKKSGLSHLSPRVGLHAKYATLRANEM